MGQPPFRELAPGPCTRVLLDLRQDFLVDVFLILDLLHVADQLPAFDVLDVLAGAKADDRAECFDFEHVFIGEGLEVDAAVGVTALLSVVEALDKERAVDDVADPTDAVSQANLSWPFVRVLAEGDVLAAQVPAAISEVSE